MDKSMKNMKNEHLD